MNSQIFEGQITEKKDISHDTIFLKLKLPETPKNTDISFFVYIYDDERVNKNPYTPISWNENEICFIIKIYYRKGISEFINSKNVGERLFISQALPKLKYNGNFKKILMICGGTGITPMLQILKHEEDLKKFTIINCNKTYKDIIINKEIINGNLDIYHLFSREENDCDINQDFYFVNKQNVMKTKCKKEVLVKILETKKIEKFDFVYVCGPPAFMKDISGSKTLDYQQGEVSGILKEMGYDISNVYKF